jgi:RimJ/RimL family protein N-acetyltransferase
MVEKVFFNLEEQWYKECLPEAAEAVRTFRGYGFESDLWVVEGGEELPAPEYDALYIADSERLLMQLQDLGAAFCGYSHSGNRSQDLKRADYILMEPQWVDRDSLVKIWQRQRHLPWTILETARCEVREFVPEDLEAIRALYDEDALKFLEAPSEDTEKERKILKAYIDRVYRLCGYGHWAVLSRQTGELVGRIGFSFPNSSAPGPAPDATFGYLVRKDWRGKGIAREVCAALIEYGFSQLGFERIGADTALSNTASDKILRSFGFREVARKEDQRYYILNKNEWSYIL